ncbi:MAG: hypothetical protein ACYCZU_04520 [Devosia sp.]
MGLKAPDVMIQLINGKTVKDPPYIGLDVCDQEAPRILPGQLGVQPVGKFEGRAAARRVHLALRPSLGLLSPR